MNKAAVAAIWIAGATVGHFATEGARPAPQVKTRVVHQTKVETRTVYTPRPVPPSCLQLMAAVKQLEAVSAVVAEVTGKHVDNMTAGGLAIYERNLQALNAATQREYKYKDRSDSAIIQINLLTDKLKAESNKCSADSRS